jgi:ethanolamine ammonia-lyase large subunit
MKSKELGKELKELVVGFFGGVGLAMTIVLIACCYVVKANASQDAPDDLYAMQCVDGKCYYATGKEVPKDVLVKFQQYMTEAMAKLEKEEEGEESAE